MLLTDSKVRLELYFLEKKVGNPTEKRSQQNWHRAVRTTGHKASAMAPLVVPSILGLMSVLVSLVPSHGDTLGVAWLGKKNVVV